MKNTMYEGPDKTPKLLPRGVVAALMAVTLAGGMVTGAILGPASASPLLSNAEIVQRALALLATRADGGSPASATPPSKPAESAPTGTSPAHSGGVKSQAASKGGTPVSTASKPATSERATPENSGGKEKASGQPVRLPPIQHVWLVVLDGTTFANATAAASAYPYLVGQLVGQGILLTNYSALDGYELAGDAALLPGGIGASVRPISEPGCDSPPPAEGGSLPCAQGAQPTPAQVNTFAQRILAPILASPTYRENGFVAITFAPTSEEAGTPTSTLALKPTAGVLLFSPLLHGGTRSSTAFQPLSPRTSLQTIFGH